MDIANYIGLFLLKNKFCYVHGLGNMELKKVPATHDGKALQSPSYQVVVTPGGSIDDNLANFIATNEQISISKAANALREYSIQARKDMAEGKDVPIPNIGKFTETNGKVSFITDSNFSYTPAGVPTIRNSKQLEEQNARPIHKPSYPPPTKADAINWSVVILVAVLLLVIAGGGYGIYYYMHQRNEAEVVTAPVQDTVRQAPVAPIADSAATDTTMAQPAMDSNQVMALRMVIGSYKTRGRADQRVEKLALGNISTEVIPAADSTGYLVITTVNARLADTTHVKDSLIRFYGYKGVMVY